MENNSMRAANKDDSDSYSDYSEVEEALSLCDLPLGGEEQDCSQEHPPISQTSDVFEFFSTDNTPPSMLSTEDIIFCGKILPYRSSAHQDLSANNHHRRHHRKSESLNDLQRTQSSSKGGSSSKYMRSSRSLDYKKLHRDTSLRTNSSLPNDRISDGKCFGKCDTSSFGRIPVSPTQTTTKPKWRLLMFGLMKAPTEMELKDIRSRQSRLIPSSFLTVSKREQEDKGSWKLLRALSCKGQANAVITASLSCV